MRTRSYFGSVPYIKPSGAEYRGIEDLLADFKNLRLNDDDSPSPRSRAGERKKAKNRSLNTKREDRPTSPKSSSIRFGAKTLFKCGLTFTILVMVLLSAKSWNERSAQLKVSVAQEQRELYAVAQVLEFEAQEHRDLSAVAQVPDFVAKKHRDLSPETQVQESMAQEHRDLSPEAPVQDSVVKEHRDISPEAPVQYSVVKEHRDISPETQVQESIAQEHRDLSPETQVQESMAQEHRDLSPEAPVQESVVKEHRDISPVQGSLVSLEDFNLIRVLGQGAFGKVYLAEHKATKKICAIKSMRKDKVSHKGATLMMREKRIFQAVTGHPFTVSLYASFQTKQRVFFAMEFIDGGDFSYLLSKTRKLPQERAKFYAACILLGLKHLHEKRIIHRDLKPANILVDNQGYLKIADFGLSLDNMEDDSYATSDCGTPYYMAPETITKTGYKRTVDFWALGVILFEMLTGKLPFVARYTAQLFTKVSTSEPTYPEYMSPEATDLIKQLLQKNPKQRLGSGIKGAGEIQDHPFFVGIDWEDLLQRTVAPPPAPWLKKIVLKAAGFRFGGNYLNLSPGIPVHFIGDQEKLFEEFDYEGDYFKTTDG